MAEELDPPPEITRRIHRIRLYAPSLRHVDLAYDTLLSRPSFRALAATLFFHHRGLLTPAAWKDVAAVKFRAA